MQKAKLFFYILFQIFLNSRIIAEKLHKLIANGGMKMKCSRRCLIRLFSFGIFALVVLIARNFILMSEAHDSKLALSNTYSSAVQQLADACRNINDTLEKELYANSPQTHQMLSVKLYHDASAAKAALSQLPADRFGLGNTYKFLSQIGNYSLAVSKKLKADETISAKDHENISKLYEFSKKLSQDIWELESSLSAGEIEITAADLSAASQQVPVVVDGFSDFEESFDDYPSLIYDGPFSDNIMEKSPKMTAAAEPVTKKQALERCCIALNSSANDFTEVTEVEGRMPGWRFSNKDHTISCEVTKNGGYLAYFLKSSEPGEEKLTRENALKYADDFLDYLGIYSMKKTYHDIQGGVMTVNYAYNDLDTCVYTDLVKVSVAMDSGEIVGYDARGFLVNHTKREYPKKLFSKLRAQQKVSPQLTVVSSQLAVIPTDGLDEKLCYEFKCKAKNDRNVLVYINAETGEEEQILLLIETPTGTLTV